MHTVHVLTDILRFFSLNISLGRSERRARAPRPLSCFLEKSLSQKLEAYKRTTSSDHVVLRDDLYGAFIAYMSIPQIARDQFVFAFDVKEIFLRIDQESSKDLFLYRNTKCRILFMFFDIH